VYIVAAGLLGLTAIVVAARIVSGREDDSGAGITTEVAALVMFLVGAVAMSGSIPVAVVLGGVVAALLQWKRPMHGLVREITDDEVRALMRIVVIGLVILPALPDRTYGPYDVLNPFQIWLMVVLIVGISVASYVLSRLTSARASIVLGGLLGGLISSTATTASYARRARRHVQFAPAAAVVAMLASTIVFARIFVEVAAVAPSLLERVAPPLGAMAAFNVLLCVVGLLRARGRVDEIPGQTDPTELRAALVFGALYGAVLFAAAAAKEHFGDAGLYAVASVSGLTDVDAITLSVANLADAGRVDVVLAWRAILLAALANLVFKAGLACVLGGGAMLRRLAGLFGPSLAFGTAILVFWPA
jgi:uncharacterized membrane protein (DUF4010 family)